MTHSDIYTKFMIEYDKANITSSYPSLTEYEIATILDKAYLALIAQKYTGKFKYQTLNTYAGILFDLKYLVKDSSKYDSSKIFLKDFKSYVDYLSIKKKIFYLIFSIFPFSAKWARKLFYSN